MPKTVRDVGSERNEFLKTEYAEVGENLRHLDDIRARTIQYLLTAFGVLMIALTAVLTSNAALIAQKGVIIAGLCVMGVLISLGSFVVERRAVVHFNLLKDRGAAIEKENGVVGQMILSDESLGHLVGGSVASAIGALYLLSIAFWISVAIGFIGVK